MIGVLVALAMAAGTRATSVPAASEAEKAELSPVEYHEEREYLVERRLLGPVNVLRRYPPKT